MSLTETAHSSAHDEPLERAVIRDLGSLSAWELWQLQKERRQLRKDYLDHWQKTVERTGTGRPVDAIITPAAPFPAPPHGYNW
jgi:amidase